MILPLGGYAGGGNVELGAVAAGILTGTVGVLIWAACVASGYWIGKIAGYPATGAMVLGFGIPMLAILVNGQMAMRAERKRAARREGETK